MDLDRELARDLDGFLRSMNRLMKFLYRQYISNHENQDITPNQYRLLHILKHNGSYKMSDLGEHVHTSFGSLTVMIDRLVAKGLVERYFLPEDRRVVMVKITEEGLDALKEHQQNIFSLLESQIEKLNFDEKTRLQKILREMKEIIEANFDF